MTKVIKYLFHIILLLLVLESECSYLHRKNGQTTADRESKGRPRVNEYYYDYADGSNYEDYQDYGSVRNNREEKPRKSGAIVDLSAFSDSEVSKALSLLTEHELSQLSELIDSEEEHFGIRKRDCHGQMCLEERSDFSDRESFVSDEHIASIKGWFSKTKPRRTRTTRTRTTASRRADRTTKRRSPLRKPGHLHDSQVQRYGQDRSSKAAVDRIMLQRISGLKKKIGKRNASHHKERRKGNSGRIGPNAYDAAIASESQGTLDDSFPKSEQAMASLQDPLEPLVRVKRED